MAISGLRSRFLVELIELYGLAIGPVEQQRVMARLTERHRAWFPQDGKLASRPELVFVDDVEELLSALDEPSGCNSAQFEAAIAEVATRQIVRRALVLGDPSLRHCLLRLIPIVEDNWPIRPPAVTLDELPSGFRLGVALLGYSRCTRLLTFQLVGAVKYALQLCAKDATGQTPHTMLDFFGDRARIEVHVRTLSQPFSISSSNQLRDPPQRNPSQRITLRPPGPSLFEQVETILGHRPSQPPPSHRPPASASTLEPTHRPPASASTLEPLTRVSSSRVAIAKRSTPATVLRQSAGVSEDKSTPPPSSRDVLPKKRHSEVPASKTRISSPCPNTSESVASPSRRKGQPK